MGTMTKERKPRSVEPKTPWAAALRALRRKLKLSQTKAAKLADMPARTWIAWENGQRVPGRMARKFLKHTFPAHKPPRDPVD